jgi:hypothetical protein
MEDNSKSFYEILSSNIKPKEAEKKVGFVYKALAWITIYVVNSVLLMLCWNYGLAKTSAFFSTITLFQSVMVYTIAKILTRGMFTTQ